MDLPAEILIVIADQLEPGDCLELKMMNRQLWPILQPLPFC